MTRRMVTIGLARALGVLAVLGLAGEAAAATYTVASGDVAGLKAAIVAANSSPGADTIVLAINGVYTLAEAEANSSGLPTITDQLEIVGNNSRIERSYADGTPNFRLMVIAAGTSVTLRNLILRNGRIIQNQGLVGSLHGGAIYSVGNLYITGSVITDNYARYGGAIMVHGGNLIIENSTLSHNGAYSGGAIAAYAIWNQNVLIRLISSTLMENGSDYSADSLLIVGSALTVRNSIVASPTQGSNTECSFSSSSLSSLGHNIVGDSSCSLSGPGDMSGTNPLLGPLTPHGATQAMTHPPLASSPALNAVPSEDCLDHQGQSLLLDQRGVARPIGAGCDIGAHESRLGHSVIQSRAAGPAELLEGIDGPLGAHLPSRSAVHDPRRSYETHDPRRSLEAHDRRDSEAHDPRRSAETHDPRRSEEAHDPRRSAEAHDPRRSSETHDPRRSEAHDRRGSDGHDPRRSVETHDPRRSEEAHDPRRSAEAHDPRRSAETHDPRRSESHDPRRSEETHDPRRSLETHDSRRSEEVHDPRRSAESHDPRRSAETHDPRRSEAHDPRRSQLT